MATIPYVFASATSPLPLSQLDDNFTSLTVFTPSGAGAVPTTVQAKLSESVSVLDFGASTALSNNSTAINAAIVYATSIGGRVYVPAGTYKITSPITVTCPIYGDGNFSSYIRPMAAITALDITTTGSHGFGLSVSDLNITYDGSVTITTACQAIRFMYTSASSSDQLTQSIFKNIQISSAGYGLCWNDSVSGGAGVPRGQMYDVLFQNIHVNNSKYYGVYLKGAGAGNLNIKFDQVDVEGMGVAGAKAWYLNALTMLTMHDCIGSYVTSSTGGEVLSVLNCTPAFIRDFNMELVTITGTTSAAPISFANCTYVELSAYVLSTVVNSGGVSHMVAVDNSTLNLIVTGIQQTSTTLTSGTLRYITFNNIGDTQFMNVLDGNILRSNCTMTVTSQKMMFVGDVVATPGQIPYSSGSWAPAAASLTIVGTPTYTGKYTKIGSLVTCTLQVVSTTSTASTAGATFFNGLPYTPSESSVCVAIKNDGSASFGNGVVYAPGSAIYTPTWPATANVVVQFSYRTAS